MQNTEAIEKSKKEDKKHFKKILWKTLGQLLIGGLIGGCFGWGFACYNNGHKSLDSYHWVQQLQIQSGGAFQVLTIVVSVCYAVVLACLYWISKRKLEECDMEDEAQCDAVGNIVALGITVSAIGQMCVFLCAGMGLMEIWETVKKGNVVLLLMTPLAILFCFIIQCFFQNRFIKMMQELCPEMKGCIYDVKFQEKWMGSCDEAEKFITYQTCYKKVRIMDKVYPTLAGVTFLISLFF